MASYAHTNKGLMLDWDADAKRLLGLTFLLMGVGVVMAASSSMGPSHLYTGGRTEFHFLTRHGIYVVMGLCAMAVAYRVPVNLWKKFGGLLLLMAIVLLVVVLVIGTEVKGSRRWINFGFFTLQASEVAKLFVIAYLAGYLVRRKHEVRNNTSGFVKPFSVLMVIAVLLLAEPDFGSVVVMMSAALGMIFLTGVRLRIFVGLLFASFVAGVLLIYLEAYRLERFMTFIEPWEHRYQGGYQLTQSLIAFGNGGMFGVGLGNGVQKLFYLPEAHTDFVFAVLAEELGLIGNLAVIGSFSILAFSGLSIGLKAEVRQFYFAAYFAYGISLLLIVQSVINFGVTLGLLPTKGLTLPLVSYGGSSLIVCCSMIGVLLRISSDTANPDNVPEPDVKKRPAKKAAKGVRSNSKSTAIRNSAGSRKKISSRKSIAKDSSSSNNWLFSKRARNH